MLMSLLIIAFTGVHAVPKSFSTKPALPGDPDFYVALHGLQVSEGMLDPKFDPATLQYTVEIDNPDVQVLMVMPMLKLEKYDLLHTPKILVQGVTVDYSPVDPIRVPVLLNKTVGPLDMNVPITIQDPHHAGWFSTPKSRTYHIRVLQGPDTVGVVSAKAIDVIDHKGRVIPCVPEFDEKSEQNNYEFDVYEDDGSVELTIHCHTDATGLRMQGVDHPSGVPYNEPIKGAEAMVLAQCIYADDKWTHGQELQRTYMLHFSRNAHLAGTVLVLEGMPGEAICQEKSPGYVCTALKEQVHLIAEYNNSHAEVFLEAEDGHEFRMKNGIPVLFPTPEGSQMKMKLVLAAGSHRRDVEVILQHGHGKVITVDDIIALLDPVVPSEGECQMFTDSFLCIASSQKVHSFHLILTYTYSDKIPMTMYTRDGKFVQNITMGLPTKAIDIPKTGRADYKFVATLGGFSREFNVTLMHNVMKKESKEEEEEEKTNWNWLPTEVMGRRMVDVQVFETGELCETDSSGESEARCNVVGHSKVRLLAKHAHDVEWHGTLIDGDHQISIHHGQPTEPVALRINGERRLSLLHAGSKEPNTGEDSHVSVLLQHRMPAELTLHEGSCILSVGPFQDSPTLGNSAAEAMGALSSTSPQYLCYKLDTAEENEAEFHFIARQTRLDQPRGKFGFGTGVEVDLVPNVRSGAPWPLEEGIRSLGIKLRPEEGFRVLSFRMRTNGSTLELPVVITRIRNSWPVDVYLTNKSAGSCRSVDGTRRFECYTQLPDENAKDEKRKSLQLVAFCGDCPAYGVGLVVEDAFTGSIVWSQKSSQQARIPWAGWDATIPEKGKAVWWKVKLVPLEASSKESSSTVEVRRRLDDTLVGAEFEIALVGGEAFASEFAAAERRVLVAMGLVLLALAVACVLAIGLTLAATLCDTRASVGPLLPAASASLFVVQLLVVVSDVPGGESLATLCEPLKLVSPSTPGNWLRFGYRSLGATVFLHAIAILRYIWKHGKGSAQALPHGLAFGSWEIRMLGLLAFPLAYGSAGILFGPSPEVVSDLGLSLFSYAIFSGAGVVAIVTLLGLLYSFLWTWSRVSELMSNERVVCTALPYAGIAGGTKGIAIYIDRVCDQLLTVPVSPSKSQVGVEENPWTSGLLQTWLSSPSWCRARSIAVIREIEHRGSALSEEYQGLSGCSQWPAGPWTCTDPTFTDPTLERKNSKNNLQAQRSASVSSVDMLLTDRSFGASKGKSDIARAHQVSVSAMFAFEGPTDRQSVAGIVCAPWLDVVIPSRALRYIEALAGGNATKRAQIYDTADLVLNVHPSQLSGPYTGGRLACCFDWGTCWPWRWPVEVAVKLALGIWAVLARWSTTYEEETPTGWMHLMAPLATLLFCLLTMRWKPYVNVPDNAAIRGAALSAALAVTFCTLGGTVPFASELAVVIALLAAVPLLVVVCGFVAATGTLLCSPEAQGVDDTTFLKQVVSGWANFPNDFRNSNVAQKHQVEVQLSSGRLRSAICLPGQTKPPIMHIQVLPQRETDSANEAFSFCNDDGGTKVPLPPNLVFPAVQAEPMIVASLEVMPIAVLVAPGATVLIYEDDEMNDGTAWESAVSRFFRSNGDAIAKKAQNLIRDHALSEPYALVVVEVLPYKAAQQAPNGGVGTVEEELDEALE